MSGALEDGPTALARVASLSIGAVRFKGEIGSSATCFPLDLSPAEELGTGAKGLVATVDGGNHKSPKSSSTSNTPVSIDLALK